MSLFGKVTVIGIGLIGSSLARVIKRDGLARRISCYDVKPQYMQKALELGIVDEIHKNIADSVKNADLIDSLRPGWCLRQNHQRNCPVSQK